ncbi:MAG TPA: DUF4442 domain-containing protein [Sediminibacterium sp.]|nr:DUF4442 domain-containing protein [Sediminibacterium sp.]
MNPKFESFQKIIQNPIKFRFFLLQKLPSALIAGLKVQEISTLEAVITVKHKWLNQNPFRSMYFAVQSMAAEMSTGLLAFGQLYQRNPSVSMLVVGMEAKFHKKAVGKIAFYCEDGLAIANAVEAATQTGQGQTIQCYSIGKNEAGEMVSEFWFTWSFKAK